MSWRGGVRRAFAYVIAVGSGFLLAYLLVAFVVFPAGVIPQDVKVPNVIGLTQTDAERELLKVGFKPERMETRAHSASPAGTVLEQAPAPGSREMEGTTVTLVVSGGQQTAAVPNVVGITREQGETTLEAAGFTVGEVTDRASDAPRGQIISMQPVAGTEAMVPSPVALVVSAGPSSITVPDVVGTPAADARRLLEQVGLTVDLVAADGGDASAVAGGTVAEQSPAATTQVPAGSRVVLRVRGSTP